MRFQWMIKGLLGFFLAWLLFCFCERPSNPDSGAQASAENQPDSEEEKVGIPVEALIVRYQTIEQNVPLTGIAQPSLSVDIVAEVSGKVESIYKKLGQNVTPSDTLAVIDDRIPLSNYKQAQSQVLSAANNLKIAQLNLRSDEELLKTGDISQLAYENSKLAMKTAEANHLSALANLSLMEKTYRDTRIMSPIRGLISRKFIDLGTMVMPNMVVYRVVDINTLKINVGIPQDVIGRIRLGSTARVVFSALNNEVFKGVVRFLSPQADETSGSFTAEIHIENTNDLRIRAGMTAKIDLLLTELGEQLAVPDYALVTRNGSNYVYKVTNNTAKLTEISILKKLGSQVVISDGLANGDTVVVVGMKNLGVETRVFIEAIN